MNGQATEQALRARIDTLEAVLTSIGDGLLMLDDQWRYTYFSETGARILGMQVEDLVGACVWDLFPHALETRFHEYYHRAVETQQPQHFEEYYPAPLDLWLDCRCYPSSAGLLVYFRDISQRKRAETALIESERRHRELFDSIPDGFCIVEILLDDRAAPRDYRFIDANPAFTEATGLENALGRTALELIPGIERFWIDTYGGVALTGEPVRFESYAAPMLRWFEVYAFRTGRAEERQVAIFFRNITQRREAEERLRQSEERFRLLVEASSQAVWSTNADGVVMEDSPSWRTFTGQTLEEWLGDGWANVVHPDDRGRVFATWKAAVRSGADCHQEFRLRRADGQWRWTQVVAAPIRDGRGRILKWVGMNTDITDHRRSEERLRESESFYRQTLLSIPGMTFTNTPDGMCDFVSEQWVDFTGVPAADQLGSGWVQLLHPDDRDRAHAAWQAAVEGRGQYDLEYRVRGADGIYKWFKVRGRAIRDAAGNVVRWFGSAIDIDDLKRAEAALKEADRRKDEFLAVLAHELRNPLAPLVSGMQVLRASQAEPAAIRRVHDIMDRQISSLVRLVDDLMDVARISHGKITLHKQRVSLALVLQSAIEASRPAIDAGGHQFHAQIPRLPLDVDGDAVRLAQVFANLLNNAAKYTPAGGRIELEAKASGDEAVVEVRDSGFGIPAEHLPDLFEPFTQLQPAGERSGGGLGLGLSLVKALLEMHGGSVDVFSGGAGQGAVFTARLPLAKAPMDAAAPEAIAALAALRVLVVDDNRDAADTLCMMLDIEGHKLRAAYDGRQALALAEEFQPDVILLDIGMPQMNGYQVAGHLRQQASRAHPVLVAVTGWGEESDRATSRAAGFDHHLVKPVDLQPLTALLNSVAQARIEAARQGGTP